MKAAFPGALATVGGGQGRRVKYPDSLHLPLSAATEDAVRSMLKPLAGERVGVFCKSGARAAKFIKDWGVVAEEYNITLIGI